MIRTISVWVAENAPDAIMEELYLLLSGSDLSDPDDLAEERRRLLGLVDLVHTRAYGRNSLRAWGAFTAADGKCAQGDTMFHVARAMGELPRDEVTCVHAMDALYKVFGMRRILVTTSVGSEFGKAEWPE